MRDLSKSTAVATVLGIWGLGSCLAALGLIAAQSAFGPDQAVLSLVMLAPAAGAAATWFWLRHNRRPWTPQPVDSRRMARTLAIVIAVCGSYFVVISLIDGAAPQVPGAVAGVPVVGFIVLQALGALCEEIGFRGILFHGLLQWLPKWTATLLVGTLFGLWHVHYFSLPIAEHLAFLLAAVLLTATMTYTMVGSFWWRMVTCTLIHLAANLALSFSARGEGSMTTFAVAAAVGAVIGVALHGMAERRPGAQIIADQRESGAVRM